MKNAGKARSYGLYRHLRTSKEIIENLLNYYTEKYKLLGGIVRQDKQSGELCICTETYSDDIKSDSWKLLSDIL